MRRRTAVLLLAAVASMAQAQPADPLVRARQLYNDGKYDAAIEAAAEARKMPALANGAAIVGARAYLERFRESPATRAEDLAHAREALSQVYATGLSARDHTELLIGLGESLYLEGCAEGCFSAAAETFELALSRVDTADAASRELVFEWWAGSLDRQAQFGPASERRPLYDRILKRAETELATNDLSPTATYWLVASARGIGDYERAWGAAVAGWVRARYMSAKGAALRAEIDQLVTLVLLPERAKANTPNGDPRPALASLRAQWDDVKSRYPN